MTVIRPTIACSPVSPFSAVMVSVLAGWETPVSLLGYSSERAGSRSVLVTVIPTAGCRAHQVTSKCLLVTESVSRRPGPPCPRLLWKPRLRLQTGHTRAQRRPAQEGQPLRVGALPTGRGAGQSRNEPNPGRECGGDGARGRSEPQGIGLEPQDQLALRCPPGVCCPRTAEWKGAEAWWLQHSSLQTNLGMHPVSPGMCCHVICCACFLFSEIGKGHRSRTAV